MAKLTTITIDNKLYDIGEIKRVDSIPSTINNNSPEIIIYNNQLYLKTIAENGNMSYEVIKADGDVEAFFPFFDSQTLVFTADSTAVDELNAMVINSLEKGY